LDYFTALTAFVEAARENNFSRAAERLGIKASTVSRYVKDLEQDLGIALFNRSTRTLHLTEGGETFLLHARRVLDELALAKAATSALNQHPRGLLKLNLPPAFARHHVLTMLPSFLGRFPEIKLEVVLDDSQVNLIHSGTDLAIRIGTLADSSLRARKIADESHCLVVSPGYAQLHAEPLAPGGLAQLPAILGTDVSLPVTFTGPAGSVSLTRSDGLRISDLDGQFIAAQAGLGFAVLPDWLVAGSLETGTLVRWMASWKVCPSQQPSAIWFVYPPKRIVSSKVRCFIDFIVEGVGEPVYWRL
jgi:DNA-binding transcriptional LysR family regulator